ncbi:hypothetical protein V8G54_030637 [Vigna mungo]|uniref:Uncharacterized protein n=1 Tax=Vigna mungo TaxID=3915 RepID=A0AAQ3RLG8_VIGMU
MAGCGPGGVCRRWRRRDWKKGWHGGLRRLTRWRLVRWSLVVAVSGGGKKMTVDSDGAWHNEMYFREPLMFRFRVKEFWAWVAMGPLLFLSPHAAICTPHYFLPNNKRGLGPGQQNT